MRAQSVLLGLFIALSSLLVPASGHPGHGSLPLPAESAAHYAFEPMHMLSGLGAGVILYFAIRWIGGCRWRQRTAQK